MTGQGAPGVHPEPNPGSIDSDIACVEGWLARLRGKRQSASTARDIAVYEIMLSRLEARRDSGFRGKGR